MENNKYEIDIYTMLKFIWKWRMVLTLSTVLFSLIVMIYWGTRPQLFQAITVLDIGKIYRPDSKSKLELIETPDTAKVYFTSDLILIRFVKELELEGLYSNYRNLISVSGNFRNVEMLPELFLNISTKLVEPEKALHGITFLSNQMIEHNNQYFENSQRLLNQDMAAIKNSIKSNQIQIESMKMKMKGIENQIASDINYLHSLQEQSPGLFNEIKDSKSKYEQIKKDSLNPSDIYYFQSNLENQKNQYFSMNREINEINLRNQEREIAVSNIRAQISEYQNRTEILQANLNHLGSLSGLIKKTSVIIPPQVEKVVPKFGVLIAGCWGGLLGFIFSLIFVFLLEKKGKIIFS